MKPAGLHLGRLFCDRGEGMSSSFGLPQRLARDVEDARQRCMRKSVRAHRTDRCRRLIRRTVSPPAFYGSTGALATAPIHFAMTPPLLAPCTYGAFSVLPPVMCLHSAIAPRSCGCCISVTARAGHCQSRGRIEPPTMSTRFSIAEFGCQIDAGSCDHNAETPGEHRACANEQRRCLARCEGRASLRSSHRR
jgi:hypothetical protein